MKIMDGQPYMTEIRELLIEYTQHLGRDPGFQDLKKNGVRYDHSFTGCDPLIQKVWICRV